MFLAWTQRSRRQGRHPVTLNEIHVPVDKPVIVYVSSKDVIHSFKVVAMRVCQDAIPGLRIPCWFTPTKVGRYQINCAQLCGSRPFRDDRRISHRREPGRLRQMDQVQERRIRVPRRF